MSRRATTSRHHHGGAVAGRRARFGRAVLAAQLLAAVAVVALLLGASGWRLPFQSAFHVEAVFTDAGGLGESDRAKVTLAGVEAGEVEAVHVRDGRTVVRLRLDDDARDALHAGATAEVRPRSALNDLEVALTSGPPSAPGLREGATIGPDRTARAVAADEVLSTLDADTRAYVQVLVSELAGAAGDARGTKLGQALEALDPAARSAAAVAGQLRERRTLLTRLVGRMDRVTQVTARRGEQLQRATGAARRTLAVTAAGGEDLEATLRALPATTREVRGALDEVQALATPLVPALQRLQPAARALPGALAALRAATPAARGLLDDVRATVKDGAAPLHDARAAVEDVGPTASGLRGATRNAGSLVREIDRNRDGIGLLGERFTGIFSTNDVNGPVLRGLGFFEAFDPANFGFPGATGAKRAAVAAAAVRALLHTCQDRNQLACLVRYVVPGLPGVTPTPRATP
ncbi:MlaD family protein [Conexibacter sp. SYSU D00693]|uniref:MlaD family protein n=1 Tax=Conexibacter sp. SYSU D00693 TaxID=2812560 RepID=UPI00196B1EAF|nr:MlaD family protein [Conexibacter sp. SYSU D00693]